MIELKISGLIVPHAGHFFNFSLVQKKNAHYITSFDAVHQIQQLALSTGQGHTLGWIYSFSNIHINSSN